MIKSMLNRAIDTVTNRISVKVNPDMIAFRTALETMDFSKSPKELFSYISDDFWIWLNTEGKRKHQLLYKMLPGMPEEFIQMKFTGRFGDEALRDGFRSYRTFKEVYEKHVGSLRNASKILDYGCGWGRIIRFFIKDIDPSRIYGCDPVEEVITICKEQNKFCNFSLINTDPPTPFEIESFDFIYSYSVFSHLSEAMHKKLLNELHRILKPGGLLAVTTRNRDFFQVCADLRKRSDLKSMNVGPRSSADAFTDIVQARKNYDNGSYCFSPLEGEWNYWGEAAIPKKYVENHWSGFTLLDFIDDPVKSEQAVIVVRKPL